MFSTPKTIKHFVLLILLIAGQLTAYCQSAKSFYKAARKNEKTKDYKTAVENYTKALALKPNNYKCLTYRGFDYNQLSDKAKSLEDYEAAFKIKNSDKRIYLTIAELAIELNDFQKGKNYAEQLIEKDKKNTEAYRKAAWCSIMLKQFQHAVDLCNTALEREQYSHVTHYYKALALDSLKKYSDANLDYVIAIKLLYNYELDDAKKIRPQYKCYFYNQAYCLHHLGDYKNAIKNYSTALEVDNVDAFQPKNYMVYYRRSQSYLSTEDYLNPIGDLNKALVLNNEFIDGFFLRAEIYKKTSQFQSAINDYTKVVLLDDKNAEGFKHRAQCYQELAKYEEAIADYAAALQLAPNDPEVKTQLEVVTKKLYEANRENDEPEFKITYPFIDGSGFINVYSSQVSTIVEGSVKDKSLIASITVNGQEAKYRNNEKNPDFTCVVPLTDATKLTIVVKDVYMNTATKTIRIGKVLDESRVMVNFAGRIVSDDGRNIPLSGKKVNLINEKGEVFFTAYTDNQGNFKFEKLPYDRTFLMAFDVEDNTPLSDIISFKVVNNSGEEIMKSTKVKGGFKFEILPTDPMIMSMMTVEDTPLMVDMKGKLLSPDESKQPLTNINVLLVNEKGEIVAAKKTDLNGLFYFRNLPPSRYYMVKIDEEDCKKITYDRILITDENNKLIKEITKDQFSKFEYRLLPKEMIALSAISEEIADPWIGVIKLNTSKKAVSIIENIYYASGAFAIPKDAEPILQKAYNALTENPKLKLEVQSHTDALAGDDFNMELSQKRANAVVEYLIKLGINKKRLTAAGFGESQLTNHCANGVECSDAEHKQNRRTVFVLNYDDSK